MSKQTNYNAGIYVRLSQEDLRAGESLSVENQRLILTKYVAEQGWNLVDEYVDDGYSGTDFERPSVKRLLEDAKNGRINLILVKDLSRFGRNYIQVGQYIDYIFPMYNIRFVALNDNIDTADSDSTAMKDMMPIMNVFNEWHCASTSKKIKAVIEANAKAGKYRANCAPFGYDKGTDEKRMPVVDEYAANIVRRIFEMRSQGANPKAIANVLNEEHIPIPSDYHYQKIGKTNPRVTNHLWSNCQVKQILTNPTYLGHLVQLRTTTVSYKNHKVIKRNEEDMVIIRNTHEAIISQELWDKCREVDVSVSQGKRTKKGETLPLCGLMYCADCRNKMRLNCNNTTNGSKKKPRIYYRANYTCGNYSRSDKIACGTHYIKVTDIEAVVLESIRSMADVVRLDENAARQLFMSQKEQLNSKQSADIQKRYNESTSRLSELEKLIQAVYEDKVLGKIPEEVCINLLEKYQAEKNSLNSEISAMKNRITAAKQDEQDVDEFIRRLRKYENVEVLTREMCLELIEYITIDEFSKGKKDEPRDIHIYYKLLDKPLPGKRNTKTHETA